MTTRWNTIAMVGVLAMLLCSNVGALKIAVLPMPGGSHIVSMKTVSETLIKKGHQVSIILSEDNLPMVGNVPAITFETMKFKGLQGATEVRSVLEIASLMYSLQGTFCRDMLRNDTITTLIKDYDIIITDSIYICSFMLPQIVNKRNIVMGIQGTLLSPIGYPAYPSNPAYIPQMGTTYSSKMNFFQRVKNTVAACLKELVMFNVMNYLAYSIKQEFNIRPDLGFYELMLSPEMTLVAGDFAVDYARPIPPNMKLIGPISSVPVSP
ncbi:UDP-glucuronosyltransferase 1-2 [Trichoplax sp. H2]|nr:UDP-glucuronosyltransferase 1-2 [Trichoplax sp. H2]|eukprot:RDD36754.1 UDP-glucuronosyltransferase 1-2 [Trichoplax sp. H2]